MNLRRILTAAAVLLVTVALAACGTTTTATQPASPPTTPDDVATAFADAYASGDVPTACGYAAGAALQWMTKQGQCAHTQWPAVTYWQGRTCQFSDNPSLPEYSGMHVYGYRSNGEINGFEGFAIGLTKPGNVWKVTELDPDGGPLGAVGRLCTLADGTRPAA